MENHAVRTQRFGRFRHSQSWSILTLLLISAQQLPFILGQQTSEQLIPLIEQSINDPQRDSKTGWVILNNFEELMWIDQKESLPFRPGEIDVSSVRNTFAKGPIDALKLLMQLGIQSSDSDRDILQKFNAALDRLDLYADIDADHLALPPDLSTFYGKYKTAIAEKRTVRQASTRRLNRLFLQLRLPLETSPSQGNSPKDPKTYEPFIIKGKESILYLQFAPYPSTAMYRVFARPVCWIDTSNAGGQVPGVDDKKVTELDDRNKDGVIDIEDMIETVKKVSNGEIPYGALEYTTDQIVEVFNAYVEADRRFKAEGLPLRVKFSEDEERLLRDLEKIGYIKRRSDGTFQVKKHASIIAGPANMEDGSMMEHEIVHAYFAQKKSVREKVAGPIQMYLHDPRYPDEYDDVVHRLDEVSNPSDTELVATEITAYAATGFKGIAFEWSPEPFNADEVDIESLKRLLNKGTENQKHLLNQLGITATNKPEEVLQKFNTPITEAENVLSLEASGTKIPTGLQETMQHINEAQADNKLPRKIDISTYNRFALQTMFPEATAKSGKGLEITHRRELQEALNRIEREEFTFLYPKPKKNPSAKPRGRPARTKFIREWQRVVPMVFGGLLVGLMVHQILSGRPTGETLASLAVPFMVFRSLERWVIGKFAKISKIQTLPYLHQIYAAV